MKLCIIGGGVTKDRAPYSSDALIWSTMSIGQSLPRVDAVFEIHNGIYSAESLNKLDCDVYMRETHADVIKSKRFPIEWLEESYGKRFNGTVVMMLAYAHLLGYKDIALYGVDMSTDEEYARRNMFYWMLGFLDAKFCPVTISPGGYLNDTVPTYMYEDDGKAYLENMKLTVQDQLTEDEHNIKALTERKAYMRGVMDTVARFERRH